MKYVTHRKRTMDFYFSKEKYGRPNDDVYVSDECSPVFRWVNADHKRSSARPIFLYSLTFDGARAHRTVSKVLGGVRKHGKRELYVNFCVFHETRITYTDTISRIRDDTTAKQTEEKHRFY